MLKGKKIVLGVTGGIAVYKAVDLVSKLRKQGAEVRVVMTEHAQQFVTPLTFKEISGNKVAVSMWNANQEFNVEHIALADWADLFMVVPATANIIAKMAYGIADDLLSTTLLAAHSPVIVCPAMNTHMYENPATQENIAKIKNRGIVVMPPAIGVLACGAVVHSKLSASERADVFYKIRNNEAQILIGVRSAVFAPFTNLGLVIIDEEHDQSYKQEERPCYHAREVALHRAKYFNIPVVLGSATPSIESYYDAIMKRFKHLRLTGRPNGQPLPKVQIVDMRKELQERNFSVLSRTLQQELVRTAAAGEQAIVLLNRRGYSTFVMCRDCGETIMCPHCAVALVYHEEGKAMRCHYCGNTMPVPEECPKCHSRRIKFFGTGTQKAEAQIAALPEVKVLRMDQDSTLRKFAHEEILNAFSSGRYNVLIGTQMVAKGHDIPNVTLVGVLSADSMLNMPDFRAYERAFSLLTQAAGRAGRGDKPGHVILQVYDADNLTVHLAAAQDYDTFAKEELLRRKELNYPPYAAFLKITVWDKNEERANGTAKEIADFLERHAKNTDAEVFGPFAGIIGKVRDLYRVNVLVKSTQINIFKTALWQSPYRDMKNVYFDVDPFNVL